ncbi:MAG TPA: hypothetical protein VN282_01945 [Pyrinomonadaceae bacterium]|nr:hypothetical protein [Pyrinomonadaceae bacterium]
MKRYCQWCRRRLRLRDMRCPYCRDPAVSLLHGTALAVAAATVLFFLMRVF